MLDLSNYITGLLFIHDCVILPGFGGFVSNYQEAGHDELSHTFTPPSKKLVFNSNLSYNDGLLINYLSQQLNVSYTEAEQMVKASVEDAWIRLERGETLTFDGIGTFRYNADNALIFDPQPSENLLTDSFGLFSFRFPPLSHGSNNKAIMNNNIDRTPHINAQKVLRYAAVVVPLAALLALVPFHNKEQQSAGIVSANITLPIEDSVTASAGKSSIDYAIEASTDKRNALFYNETPAKITNRHISAQKSTYYIIGGSFKDRANANEYVAKYKKAGFSDAKIIESETLFRVSLCSFDDKVVALHELRRIRAKEQYSNLWLYTKPN